MRRRLPTAHLPATSRLNAAVSPLYGRRLPFDDGNVGRLFRAIKGGAFTLPTHLSGSARDLLRRMLTVDPLRRISVEEIR